MSPVPLESELLQQTVQPHSGPLIVRVQTRAMKLKTFGDILETPSLMLFTNWPLPRETNRNINAPSQWMFHILDLYSPTLTQRPLRSLRHPVRAAITPGRDRLHNRWTEHCITLTTRATEIRVRCNIPCVNNVTAQRFRKGSTKSNLSFWVRVVLTQREQQDRSVGTSFNLPVLKSKLHECLT